MSRHVAVMLGTRPEIIKLAPVISACTKHDVRCTIIHTGQHYSDHLDSVFFEQLGLPEPDYNLRIGSASHGEQTGTMLIEAERVLEDVSPDTVLVQGDTNSVLAGALAASKMDIELGHVEAGLRSFNREMPEELNRIVTDHLADQLFAPTEKSEQNLRNEGIPASRITVTGNTVVDALYRNRRLAQENSSILRELNLVEKSFFVLTVHRAENVDTETRFEALLSGVSQVARKHQTPVLYPIHPRAQNRLTEFDIEPSPEIRLIEPQEYLDFLRLEDEASLILTDSGGVQEEACILGTPCVTLRESTERPETVDIGANVLSGHTPKAIRSCADQMVQKEGNWENPFGDGKAGQRILHEITPETREVYT
jgi:UDP-N-acetylglucosamine 2-epimerase (non-hydrolysing)